MTIPDTKNQAEEFQQQESSTTTQVPTPSTGMSTSSTTTPPKPSAPVWYSKLSVHEKSLEDQANWFSAITLSYLSPLLRLGSIKVLDHEDIGVPSHEDEAKQIFVRISKAWKYQIMKIEQLNHHRKAIYDAKRSKLPYAKKAQMPRFVPSEPSITKALIISFGVRRILWAISLNILAMVFGFIPIYLLKDLVNYVASGGRAQTFFHPWLEAVLFGLVPLVYSILQTRSMLIFNHFSIFARTAISTLLYEKAMHISASGKASTNTGQVVNMMSTDASQLQRLIQNGGLILVSPLVIIASLILIFIELGNATWVGVGLMLFLIPVNGILLSVVSNMRKRVLKYSDLRVKLMNEILTGIRIIKYYAWEKPFQYEVERLRANELKYLTNMAYVSAAGFSLLMQSAPIIQLILVFYTYVQIQDEALTVSSTFAIVSLFTYMRVPLALLTMGMLQYSQSKVSLRRFSRYLQLRDIEKYVNNDVSSSDGIIAQSIGCIVIQNGSFSWTSAGADVSLTNHDVNKRKSQRRSTVGSSSRSSKTSILSESNEFQNSILEANSLGLTMLEDSESINIPALRNINVSIKPGELIAVVGTVGSGKSSLLSAILGDMEPTLGSSVLIPNGRNNCVNFMSYCCQSPWVINSSLKGNILLGRDFDEARYNLVIEACALIDDIRSLPAGDSTEIGERGINLSGGQKARVALARALYSPDIKILLLDDSLAAVDAHVGEHLFSRAVCGDLCGTMTRIMVTNHLPFLSRCDRVLVMENGEIKHFDTYVDLLAAGVVFPGEIEFDVHQGGDQNRSIGFGKEKATANDQKNIKDMKEYGHHLISKEERKEGSITGSVYSHYVHAGGVFKVIALLSVQAAGRTAEVLGAFWLGHWATVAGNAFMEGIPLTKEKTIFYVDIYALYGMLGVVGLTVRAIFIAWHRLYASQTLHDNLTRSILRAPVAFFDVTPIGRVLNRFAADMDKIDLDLTQSISQGMDTVFSVLGAIGAIMVATKGTFLVPLVPIASFFYLIQKWFRKTSTELQRLTSISGSPIIADFSQVLSGTATIRAFKQQSKFMSQFENSLNKFNSSCNLFYLTNLWIGLRLDLIGYIICAFIAGLVLATMSTGFIPAGWVGLALSFAIEIPINLKFLVRTIAAIEADMNSVERVLFYSNQIKSESSELIPGKEKYPEIWPSMGMIDFDNVSMRYRNGPLVLKQITISIRTREKVGIVGRTGSGKSSLMNALFRTSEIENDGGKILIDGVDISEIGLEDLRRRLSIIPQDPIMFSDTIRFNLDPFREASDEEMWSVLERVQLRETINDLPLGLDQSIVEGGEFLSQGQRQLICIARSLLRKPKILVMDEATASIDNATDAIVQKMIRTQFTESTVLTIAHRLNTIMDSDRILVLDDGKVTEFDTPGNLLALDNGIFRAMVEKNSSMTIFNALEK